ncbi:hypothetical protein [Xanthomonas sp. 1678]|uniref:hypothetical protein n=1 Tax=Xanthomonas sp. 1678 TaxID=3158788 RepID=UPI002863C38C|nr:hypothetical protein [Xanthomonas translucens]
MDNIILASEDLDPGDFVNIYDNGGIANARKADASAANADKVAQGFVRVATAAGSHATVYFKGTNDRLVGLTPGLTYALSHSIPGAVIELGTATTTAGESLQVLGVAVTATTLYAEIDQPIIRG